MRTLKNVVTVMLASALVLAAFPAAALVGSWSNPVNLSAADGEASNPQITVDSTGLATAVWDRSNGSHLVIQSSTSLNGGTWSTPVDVSLPGQNADSPQVTVDSTGLVTAVWRRSDGSRNIIQSSTSLNGGTWSTPVNLSLTGQNAATPQVTVDSTGLVTAVWRRSDGTHNIIQSSTSLGGGTWSTPVNLSVSGQHASIPQVTVDSTGLAVAVWMRWNGSNDIIQSSTSLGGGTWSTPINVSASGGSANKPQVTVSSTGLATAIWYRYEGDSDDAVIQSSTSQSGGSWSTPVNLSDVGRGAYDPQVKVDSTGLATAVWHGSDGSNDIIQSSTSQSGGSWSNPVNVSVAGRNGQMVQISVDSSGFATAVWQHYDGGNYIAQSSNRPRGGTWSTPVNLSATGQDSYDHVVTVDSTGLVTAVWALDASDAFIQSSTFYNPIPTPTPTASSAATPTPKPTAPALAKTGSEVNWLAFGSLIAVVVGSAFLVLGRGRRTE